MSNMMSLPASEFFKNIKNYHQNIDDNFEQPSMIIPKLRAYQCRAVKWMIDRENNNDCKLLKNKFVFKSFIILNYNIIHGTYFLC